MRLIVICSILFFPIMLQAADDRSITQATKDGDIDKVKQLLKQGNDVNKRSRKGNTALHIASSHGYLEIVKLLVESNAKLNIQNPRGATPLFVAAKNGRKEVVQYLLSQNADRDISSDAGNTPAEAASNFEHTDVEYILRNSSSKTALAVLIDFHDKKISAEDFSRHAQKALKNRNWEISKTGNNTFQGDLETSTMRYKVKISFHETYVMIRYIKGYNVDDPAYLQNLAADFKSYSGL